MIKGFVRNVDVHVDTHHVSDGFGCSRAIAGRRHVTAMVEITDYTEDQLREMVGRGARVKLEIIRDDSSEIVFPIVQEKQPSVSNPAMGSW